MMVAIRLCDLTPQFQWNVYARLMEWTPEELAKNAKNIVSYCPLPEPKDYKDAERNSV